jgi:hypothetical protein
MLTAFIFGKYAQFHSEYLAQREKHEVSSHVFGKYRVQSGQSFTSFTESAQFHSMYLAMGHHFILGTIF